jgi:cysteine desulfurase
MIYLDWNATAPLRPAVLEAMLPYLTVNFGNPSSIHAAGRAARVALDEAREKVAALLGADQREIVFTSGATEANNLIIQGAALKWPGRRFFSSPVEHPSVLEPLTALAERGVIRYEKFALDSEGALAKGEGSFFSGEPPAFVSVMYANNETGRIFPVQAVAQEVNTSGGHMHSDLTQAAGRVPLDVHAMRLTSGSVSAHKIGGPKGVGALFVKRGITVEKTLFGGKQERSRRPGTENVAAIVGFGAAAEAAMTELSSYPARVAALRERLWHGLRSLGLPLLLNTPLEESVPNTLNVSLPGKDANFLLQRLDMAGLCVSAGAACASGSPEPSPVLTAIGYPQDRIRGALRFSLGPQTTEADIDQALKTLNNVLVSR